MESLYTAEEMSKALKVNMDTIWRWGREGKLRTEKIGRTVRFYMPGKERPIGNKNKAT